MSTAESFGSSVATVGATNQPPQPARARPGARPTARPHRWNDVGDWPFVFYHEHLGYAKLAEARRELGRLDPATTLPHRYRRAAVRAALGQAISSFNESHRLRPDLPYNRHAAAHRFFAGQYRPVNSLVAVMLAVSVVVDLDLHLRVEPSALETMVDARADQHDGGGLVLRRPTAG